MVYVKLTILLIVLGNLQRGHTDTTVASATTTYVNSSNDPTVDESTIQYQKNSTTTDSNGGTTKPVTQTIMTTKASTPNPEEETKQRILRYGTPQRGCEPRVYTNHVISYDQSKKTPVWVAELITQDTIQGTASRKHSNFMPDPDIPSLFSADNSDYRRSGWSRGHMAPAGDNKFNQKAMDDTFYLSNIVPQDIDNNAGFWNRFEMYCRDLAKRFDSVLVVSGSMVLPSTMNDRGQKVVTYPVIGQNEVAVPTHLYKVILVEADKRPIAIGCFIVPNEPIENKNSLKEFQVTLEEIQKRTGVIFFPKLENNNLQGLCAVDSCVLGKRHR